MLKRTLIVAALLAPVVWLAWQAGGGIREALPEPPASRTRLWSATPGCPDVTSDAFYFPIGTFSRESGTPSGVDEFLRQWYSKHLRALEQTSLVCGRAPATAYRFSYLRSFHHPLAVQVDAAGEDEWWLSAWETDGAGGYEPGTVVRRVRRRLSPNEWAEFQGRVTVADVCALDAVVDSTANDGAAWIVEVKERGAYCAVSRQSPRDGEVRALGLLFIAASGFVENHDELY